MPVIILRPSCSVKRPLSIFHFHWVPFPPQCLPLTRSHFKSWPSFKYGTCVMRFMNRDTSAVTDIFQWVHFPDTRECSSAFPCHHAIHTHLESRLEAFHITPFSSACRYHFVSRLSSMCSTYQEFYCDRSLLFISAINLQSNRSAA